MLPYSPLFLQKTYLCPSRLRRRGRFSVFFIITNKKPRVFGKTSCFSAFLWNHTMFFSLHFFIGKTYMFEHRNLSKNLFRHVLLDFEKILKIDHFERGISEHFPRAHDGIHMKFLNLELFISKALCHTCFQFLCFPCCPGFGPWQPPSKLGYKRNLVKGLPKP